MSKPTHRIIYLDADGNKSDRRISEIAPDSPGAITAHCHLRNEERTFLLERIERLIDLETGNVIKDAWGYFGLHRKQNIPALEQDWINALRVLKYLAYKLRGLREREYRHFSSFLIQAGKIKTMNAALAKEITSHLSVNEDEYGRLLMAITANLMPLCRHTALAIAFGSGRRPVNQAVYDRIDLEFPVSGGSVYAGPLWPDLYIDEERPIEPETPSVEYEDPYELIRAQLNEFKLEMQLLLAVAGLTTDNPSQGAREVVVRFIATHSPVDQQAAALLMRYMRCRSRTRVEDVMRLGHLAARDQASQQHLPALLAGAREILRMNTVQHNLADQIAHDLAVAMSI